MSDLALFCKGYQFSNNDFSWVFRVIAGSPVIITVPHDGDFFSSDISGLFQPRDNGIKMKDCFVWPIAKDVLLNVGVNAVRGLFPRSFIDYNRSPNIAFTDGSLKNIYDSYHQAISDLIKCSMVKYGREKCLLIDLHGFTAQPSYGEYDLIFGTDNTATVKNLCVDRLLANFLTDRNYKVFLPLEKPIGLLPDKYNAGFTVRHYAEKFGIDSIQIEIARRFRTVEGAEDGRRLSADLAEFFRMNYAL